MKNPNIMAAMKSHFAGLGTPFIDVPEWQIDEKPLRIFWKPLTLEERAEIFETDGTDLDIFVRKAIDADGNRLFDLEDKVVIRKSVAAQVVQRVAIEMMKLSTAEQLEKK